MPSETNNLRLMAVSAADYREFTKQHIEDLRSLGVHAGGRCEDWLISVHCDNSKFGPLSLEFDGNDARLRIGPKAKIAGRVQFWGSRQQFEFGGLNEGPANVTATLFFDNSRMSIGTRTTINHLAAYVGRAPINIGEDCMISSPVVMSSTDSHAIVDIGTREQINEDAPISLANHVWVGEGVTTLKNVDVGLTR